MPDAESSGSAAAAGAPIDRPKWWVQIVLVGAVWWFYDAVNNLSPLRAATAFAHGSAILRVETSMHLAAERWLNQWLGSHLLVGRWLGNFYDLAHFGVTIAVLVWLWWRHPGRYIGLRNALLGMNVIGFLTFWVYPVAPPRMLGGAGFVDVVAVAHSIGAWGAGALASQANEYAAMPSLHVAWALWCTLAMWSVRRHRPARAVAAGYSALVIIAVMATGNHYFLDVVAGAVTAAVASAAALLGPRLLSALRAGRSPREHYHDASGADGPRQEARTVARVTVHDGP